MCGIYTRRIVTGMTCLRHAPTASQAVHDLAYKPRDTCSRRVFSIYRTARIADQTIATTSACMIPLPASAFRNRRILDEEQHEGIFSGVKSDFQATYESPTPP